MLNKVFSALGKGGTAAATTALRYGNKFLGSSAGKQTLLNASTHAKWQAGFMAYTLFFSRGTPEEKIHSAATQLGTFMLTAGVYLIYPCHSHKFSEHVHTHSMFRIFIEHSVHCSVGVNCHSIISKSIS
jgi:hypothetical protein